MKPIRGGLILLVVLVASLYSISAHAYTLYGYQDASGTVHLSESRLDDNYVLLKDSPVAPRLTIQEARRLIRIKHAVQNGADPVIHRHVFNTKSGTFHYPALITNKSILACIKTTGQRYKLDPALLYAVIEQESGFKAKAVSPKGAMGMMQLMPDTARQWGLQHPFDPAANINAGARHLRWLFDKLSNLQLALAAYNAGHANVVKYGGVPPFPETKLYVARIMERYQILQGG